MDIKKLRAVVQPPPKMMDKTGWSVSFLDADGRQALVGLHTRARNGVGIDPEDEGPIVIEPLIEDCEALVRLVAKLLNEEIGRMKSPSLSEVIEDWFRGVQDYRWTFAHARVAGLAKALSNIYGVDTTHDYIVLLDERRPLTMWHDGRVVRHSHPFSDIFDTEVFQTFFKILQDAGVDFGTVSCGAHGVFSFRELSDPSKN